MAQQKSRWWEDSYKDVSGYRDYAGNIQEIRNAVSRGEIDEDTAKQLRKSVAEQAFTPSSFDMGEFEGLLGRLESSKMRQQRQKSVEGRRDIMSGGLAGMMSNF